MTSRLDVRQVRRDAMSALRESEERFRAVFEHAATGISIADWEGRLQHCNPAFSAMLGYSEEELRERDVAALLHPDDREANMDWIARLRAGEVGSFEIENRYLHRDGHPVWVHKVVSTLGVDGSDQGSLLALVTDITERRAAAEARAESEARFRAFIQTTSDIVFSMSPDWSEMRYLQGRESVPDMREPSRSWLERYVPDEDRGTVTAAIEHAIATQSTFELEHRVIRVDGAFGWLHSRAIPILDEDERIVEWFGAASDVTARKITEQRLRESEERQSFLLELSDVLRPLRDATEVQAVAARLLGARLGASRAHYAELVDGGETVLIQADYHPGTSSVVGTHPLADFGAGILEELHARRTVVIADTRSDARLDEDDRERIAGTGGIGACVIAPTGGRDTVAALLVVHHAEPHDWTQQEIGLVEETADRTWSAVLRASAEAAVRRSEAALQAILDSMPAGIVIADPEGRIIRHNAAFRELWGEPPQTDSWRDYKGFTAWWPETGKRIKPHEWAISRAILRGEVTRGELIMNQRFGSHEKRYYLNNVAPIRDQEGTIIGAVGALLDVTERRQVEDAARESETRFRTVADNMSQLAWMADERGRTFWVNRRWLDFTGLSLAQVRGRGWKSVHHPEHIERVLERIERSGRSGSPWEDTYPLRGRDGQYRWFLSRAEPIRDEAGRIVYWFGTSTDISALMETEAALVENEARLRAALTVKDEFLGLVSHELRTPLTVVIGMSRLLAARDLGPEKARDIARDVVESAEALNEIVESMLMLARLDREEATQLREPVPLQRVAKRVVGRWSSKVEGERLVLQGAEQEALTDVQPQWLEQVIDNLVGNAVKYADRDKPIVVRIEAARDVVSLRVLDRGPGLSDIELMHVFEPFYRTPTAQLKGGGVGLGLAVCKRIVESMGGHIWAGQRAGGGSEFGFVLPRTESPEG